MDDPNTSTTARVVRERWLNLESGIHQELVDQSTSSCFSARFGFRRRTEWQNAMHAFGDPEACSPEEDEDHPAEESSS